MDQEPSFGQFIKSARQTLGLTQAELARRVGCATITIRKIEADAMRPSVQILERLAMAMDIPLEDRAGFVRKARKAVIGTPELPPTATPAPTVEEIGGEDLTGRAVRGYQLAERIGEGGFGAVYRAVQPAVEREVAVKIILPRYANDPDFIRRFEAEAQLVARLEHPFIVPLYDYWREPNAAYLIMRLMRGGSLKDLLKSGAVPLAQVLPIIEQVIQALHAAHRFGVIHRDLKPANILLDDDQNAYLADFGIAKNLGNPEMEDHTQTGTLIGSFAYLSPEQIRSESVLPQADIYSLGVLLFQLLAGNLPFEGPTPIDYIQQHLNKPLPSLLDHNPGLPPALETVIQRATAKEVAERHSDVLALMAEIREAIGELGARTDPGDNLEITPVDPETIENPFKGLRSFGEADAEDFFGRETLIQDLLGKVAEEDDLSRFLAVVGPSGSGKSSVIKAGLVPALRRGGLQDSEKWFIVDFLPGSHPFEELEAALLRVAINPPGSLLEQLLSGERGLLRAVRRILPADEKVELILVIDQFEELFTLVEDTAIRINFLESLVAAVMDSRSRLRVVITLRADFIDRPLEYVDFGELMRERTTFVLPLTPDELEEAVLGPTRRVGLVPEAGLVPRIGRELGDQPGTLPLLQHTLSELFERRDGRRMTLAAYEEVGGVLGSLGRTADEVHQKLDPAEQDLARQLFLRLVTLGEGVEDTRRRVLRSEVEGLTAVFRGLETSNGPANTGPDFPLPNSSALGQVIDRFGKARLLTFDRDPATRRPTVEVAHEALLREWSRLRGWLDESRADVRMQRLLSRSAEEWRSSGEDPSFLLRGRRLEQFEGWAEATTIAMTANERTYLDTCLAEREERETEEAARLANKRALEKRSIQRLRIIVGVLIVASIAGILLTFAIFRQSQVAQNNAQLAIQNAATATVAEGEAVIQAATALAAQGSAESAREEAEAAKVQALSAQSEAEVEAEIRATAQVQAEQQADLARARELALAGNLNLEVDPDLSILLGMQSLSLAQTSQGEEALRKALHASRTVQILEDQQDPGHALAYSPDGSLLAASEGSGAIQVYDPDKGTVLFTFTGHSDRVTQLVFSRDGTKLASASNDQTARIWDVRTGQVLNIFEGHENRVISVAFSPDGSHLATGTHEEAARIWDAETGELLLTMEFPGYGEISFTPDGQQVISVDATVYEGLTKIWDLATGEEILTLPGFNFIGEVPLSPDGSLLATTDISGFEVSVWDLEAVLAGDYSQPLYTLAGHSGFVSDIAFGEDENGTLLATGGLDSKVVIWRVSREKGEALFTLHGHTDSIWDVDFSPNGKRLATTSSSEPTRIWDITPEGSREFLTFAGHSGRVYAIDYHPDGTRVATGGSDGKAIIWSSNTGQVELTLSGHTGPVKALAFNPDGTRLATGSEDNTARIWDPATGEVLMVLVGHENAPPTGGVHPGIIRIEYHPTDPNILATAGADGMVRLWETTTGENLAAYQVHPEGNGAIGIAFSPDGSQLAAGSDDGFNTGAPPNVKVWELSSGTELYTLTGFPSRVWEVEYSPDGKEILTGGGSVLVWDAETGEQIRSLPAPGLLHGDFTPDGVRLVTIWRTDTTVWDFNTGQKLFALPGHTGFATGVVFSPDGTQVATTNRDGTAKIYLLEIDELVTLAESRLVRWFTLEECQQYLYNDTCPPVP